MYICNLHLYLQYFYVEKRVDIPHIRYIKEKTTRKVKQTNGVSDVSNGGGGAEEDGCGDDGGDATSQQSLDRRVENCNDIRTELKDWDSTEAAKALQMQMCKQ